MKHEQRGQWAGNLGFILAASGSAVGLGNLVKFPYLAGRYGGGAFLLVYLIFIVLVGFTVMLAELVIGRTTHKNCLGAFRELNPKFSWIGGLGVLVGFIINSYYCVIGGWTIKYFVRYLTGDGLLEDSGAFFDNYLASGLEPILWALLFLALTGLIVWRGVSGGIEKAGKVMMPALVVLLLVIVVRSLTLPGAAEGIRYYIVPDFSKITPGVIIAALSQVFFSLSLGMGIMVTYGSYLSDKENLSKNSLIIPAFDTAIAFFSGLAVLPAMMAAGLEPGESTIGSLFVAMPGVFSALPFPRVFGALFFLLVVFAALTSSISLLEGTTAFVSEETGLSRKKTVVLLCLLLFVIGCFASLSLGGNISIQIPQVTGAGIGWGNLFDLLSNTPDMLLMPLAGLMVCIFVGWIWGVDKASESIEKNGAKFYLKRYWKFGVRYVAPVCIVLILLTQLGIIRIFS